MSLREKLNQPVFAAVVIVVIIGLVVVTRMSGGDGKPLEDHGFFYDLQSRKIIALKLTEEISPVKTAGSTEAVRVVMLACGTCEDASRRTPAYMEMWDEKSKAAMKTVSTASPADSVPGGGVELSRQREAGHMVAKVPTGDEKPRWVTIGSSEGAALIAESSRVCTLAADLRQCAPLPSDLK